MLKIAGFSLLETLITLAIMSIGIASFNLVTQRLAINNALHIGQSIDLSKQMSINSLTIIAYDAIDQATIANQFDNANPELPNTANCSTQPCSIQQLIDYEATAF